VRGRLPETGISGARGWGRTNCALRTTRAYDHASQMSRGSAHPGVPPRATPGEHHAALIPPNRPTGPVLADHDRELFVLVAQ